MANPPATSTYTQLGTFMRDDNAVPITWRGLIANSPHVLAGTGAAVAIPIFTVTGQVEVTALYGVITTALGTITASYWRTNDGSTQNSVTLSSGTTLTSAIVGAVISKKAGVGTALALSAGTSALVSESATAGATNFQDFALYANPAATSNIEFVFTTSDPAAIGAITFYIRWVPLTKGAQIFAI